MICRILFLIFALLCEFTLRFLLHPQAISEHRKKSDGCIIAKCQSISGHLIAEIIKMKVIFIDEVDSLLSQRNDSEHESSRRIKTEFLVQLDGATTDNDERILVVGATNRPHELDEAARRRFVKRLYIPLPEYEARLQLVKKLISNENHRLLEEDFQTIATLSEGYSGADIRNLCSEASLGPIRSIDMKLIEEIQAAEVRPLLREDFEKALMRVKSSVSSKDLEQYTTWDKTYGSGF